MVTKTFCDHCGHVARNHKVLSFGDIQGKNVTDARHQIQMQMLAVQNAQAQRNMPPYAGGGGGGGIVGGSAGMAGGSAGMAGAYYAPPPSGPEFEIINVDLCQHCVPLWMNRVKAITKASDPE